MRKFKTAEKNRTNYIYYTAEGTKVVLKPGKDGVDETWITMLHDWDDSDVDTERRENRNCPVRLESYIDGDGENADDRNTYLEDKASDPLQQILTSIADEEYSIRMEKLKTAISELSDKQRETIYKKFYKKMTNVDIAAEEGVSEAAIRNRLTKIYAALKKKIEKI